MSDNAMTIKKLQSLQSLPLDAKVRLTQAKLLEMCLKVNWGIAIAYSGGKDSSVLLDIASRFWAANTDLHGGRPLVVVFADTSNEHKGMGSFVRQSCEIVAGRYGITIDLHTVRGEMTYPQVIANYGYPIGSKQVARKVGDIRRWLRESGVAWDDIKDRLDDGIESADYLRGLGASHTVVLYLTGVKSDNTLSKSPLSQCWRPLIPAPFEVSNVCCDILKKAPIKAIQRDLHLVPVIAEMAADSKTRQNAYLHTGCNSFDSREVKSKPMGFWMPDDPAQYIYHQNVPLFGIYGVVEHYDDEYRCTGEQHTGCKLCLFGCRFPGRQQQFTRLAETEPQTVRWAFKPVVEGGLGYTEIIGYLNQHCGCKIEVPDVVKA